MNTVGTPTGLNAATVGASFKASYSITGLQISYTGEQWSGPASTGAPDKLVLQLSTSATAVTGVNATGFVTQAGGTFTAPNQTAGATQAGVAATSGNAAGNKATVTFTITGLTIPANQTFWIRWQNANNTPNVNLAVDDFSIIATPEPSTYGLIGGLGLLGFGLLALGAWGLRRNRALVR